MAQVAEKIRRVAANEIDGDLDYLLRAWLALPDTAAEWDSWIADQKNVFELEWAVKESRLEQLEARVRAGELSPNQTRRYRQLLKLINQNRLILEEIFAS